MSTSLEFPASWMIAQDYEPNAHKINLKGKDYLDVQNRMIWFIRDQRRLIAEGLATCSYLVRTELVEHDAVAAWAQFKTTVRDVLGNEATMYGSEARKDFGDYLEKASTKSLGRALAMLGYGTQFAPEMGEGERVVDSPVENRPAPRAATPSPQPSTGQQQRSLRERARLLGYISDQQYNEMLRKVLGKSDEEMARGRTPEDMDKLRDFVVFEEAKAREAAARAANEPSLQGVRVTAP